MTIAGKRDALLLFTGDIIIFSLSLWLMLFLRHLEVPSWDFFELHFVPFSLLFVVWVLVFFISGLYGKHTMVLKKKLPVIILNAQVANMLIAALFFFLVPYFGIAPKTTLFIYLLVSFPLVLWWRLSGQDYITRRIPEAAILVGSGLEMEELRDEVNQNSKYGIRFDSYLNLEKLPVGDFKDEIIKRVYSENISVIVIDLKNEKVEPILPSLYNLLFAEIKFIDFHKVYEDIFDRIPLSILRHNWFLENISLSPKVLYDIFKRLMDIAIALVLFIISLAIFPFVYLAIKLDDKGDIFFTQERVGEHNKIIKIWKFRSMSEDKGGESSITGVGKFLRKSRIDELPQLWNVIRGDMSLIGPRPEMPELAKEYETQIPYYNIRHLIKPGLSGWAQIQTSAPKFKVGFEETRDKLSYDLYYIKNRSLFLDFNIALLTIKTLISRSGI